MLGVLLCAPAKVGSYAAFVALQRLLVCVARKYLYTCTDAFALPSTALRHHSSIIYMHTRICLAQHGTRANAPSFLLLNAVEQSLHLRRTYMYIAHASIHAVYIHIFMHICRFHIFMLAFMLGACVARPWIYSYSKVCHTRKQCARLFAAWAIAVIACVQIDLRSIWDRS